MPVIVVGADTPHGRTAIEVLEPRVGELRAFVTDPAEAESLKSRGIKVAVGDISDGSHVGGAALRAFCAVVIAHAAHDDRERSFAATPEMVVAAWADGLADAGIHRVIWVDDGTMPNALDLLASAAAESARVATADRSLADIGNEIAELESKAEV